MIRQIIPQQNKIYILASFILISVISLILFIFINGCSGVKESLKILWGSSVKSLENARTHAVSRSYSCKYDSCFEEVIKILEKDGSGIFIKDKDRHLIVAMDIKHCITTTEVGVFFVEEDLDKIKIEVTSLSPKARRIASELIFAALDTVCPID